MNVTIDILNESGSRWLPELADCETWITSALAAASYNEDCGISFKYVTEEESAELNESYRGKASATNVLSFPADLPREIASQLGYSPLGDIVICPAVLETEAIAQGKTLLAHWVHLLTHGALHLLGYDHEKEDEAQKMEALEVLILKNNGFENPYTITRS